jgi:hypothetical protein
MYSNARSFRDAEGLGIDILLPISYCLTLEQIKQVINAAKNNSQIYEAAGTPEIMAKFFDVTEKYLDDIKNDWIDLTKLFIKFINKCDYDTLPVYSKLRQFMKNNGIEDSYIPWRDS